eukprot:154463-Chlamydomonas_euryale.AAC.1
MPGHPRVPRRRCTARFRGCCRVCRAPRRSCWSTLLAASTTRQWTRSRQCSRCERLSGAQAGLRVWGRRNSNRVCERAGCDRTGCERAPGFGFRVCARRRCERAGCDRTGSEKAPGFGFR